MVSFNKLINLGLIAAVIGGFYYFGGASGIGQKIGSGVAQFGSSIISGLSGIIPQTAGINGKSSIQEIVQRLDLENIVTGVPDEIRLATEREKGVLTLAGFIQSENLGGTINLQTGVFSNAVTTQPLDFAITNGMVRTGTTGLSSELLALQAELSKTYGIPTFDITGAVSTFGGIVSGAGVTGGGSDVTGGSTYTSEQQGIFVNKGGGISSYGPSSTPSPTPSSTPSPTPSPTPSSTPSSTPNNNVTGGGAGVTGGSQPSSRQGTYSGGRRF
jgi:hypothetical protein